jgi:flagellar secretion chaperone FliS
MNGFGVAAYRRTGIDTGVAAATPHELVLMMYDAALEAVRQGELHLQAGQVAAKGTALGKATRIVEEGLKASIDVKAGGALAGQLAALYDYVTLRLLQANLRNDRSALQEVLRLLGDLRAAWAQIGGTTAGRVSAPAPQAGPETAPAGTGAGPAVAPAAASNSPAPALFSHSRLFDAGGSAPSRSFAASA